MKVTYDTLVIDVPYQVLGVLDIKIQGRLNEHGRAEIVFQCRQEDAKDIVLRSLETDRITITENDRCLFAGVLSYIREKRYKGMTCVSTEWKTCTVNLDIVKRKLAITGTDLRFADILDRIAQHNRIMYLDYLQADTPVPGFLLQYDETDWEFMKRLAAMRGGVLVPDHTSPQGGFSFGIRDTAAIPIVDEHGQRTTLIDYAAYDKKEAGGEDAFIQDCYHFTVSSHENYELGQMVAYGYVDGLIEDLEICGDAGMTIKKYGIVTRAGVRMASRVNRTYSGLHLPATVSEVQGNQIRVDFDIEQLAGSQKRYFPYAVESSAWYCMPEAGSSVHIYLPENDETKAYAVHSMRNTSQGAANAGVTSDPAVKSFTHPSGSAMQMDGQQLCLTADSTGQTQATLGGDGSLGLKARKITIKAAGRITIGTGDTSTENVALSSGLDITMISEQGAYAYLGEQTFLQGQMVSYAAKLHDAVEIPDVVLHRNDGIDEAIENVNYGAKQVQLQKVQEAKSKMGMGVFAMVAGAAAIAAVSVLTCGAALVVVGAAAGTAAAVCGAAMAAEGVQDYKKTMESGDYSQSFNFVRDTVFQGNQTLYDVVTYGSVLICGIVVATATGGGGLEALKLALSRTGTEMVIDTAMNLAMDYIDDGSINNGWESYFKNMCTTGATAGLSMGVMNKFKALERAGKYSCAQLSRMRLAADVGLDTLVSVATTGDADLGQIFLRNYLSNKLTLADPVDGATGSLYIPATDMRVPDFYEDYCITRKYESINRRTGMLGYGWTCSLESRFSYRSGACLILCTDGHVEGFHKRNGVWENDKGNTQRMQLQEYAVDGQVQEWRLYDAAKKMRYIYDRTGRLTGITEHHGRHARYLYENGTLCAVTTFAGAKIEVTMENGRLVQLKDALGRTVTYTYENDHLVCVDQNGRGLTRYTCDDRGRITEITDQNNKKYTRNTYDLQGRVVRQDYPDGTSCEITYDNMEHSVSFYYPETGSRQTTRYDARWLVGSVEYQDGTSEEYTYDDCQNPVREKDRNGNVTVREYSACGDKTREILPNGLEKTWEYDAQGNLVCEKDSQGSHIRYTYDERNDLTEKATLLDGESGLWGRERYGYDAQGRMIWKEDARGNRRLYEYHGRDTFCPAVEVSPEGYEFFHAYDAAGRKTLTETALNRIRFSYNGLHYVNHVTDGEGNETHEERDNLGSLIRHYSHRQYQAGRGYSYEYDHLDRLVRITDPLGRVKRLVRDGQGNILYESPLSAAGRIPGNDRRGGISTVYDANSYPVEISYPDGGIRRRKYDAKGSLVYEEPAEGTGAAVSLRYDALDRLTRVERADGTVEKELRYDLKGNLTEETNALGEKTLYTYDTAGRRTGMWEQAGEDSYRVTVYLYDGAGNVTEERRGRDAVRALERPVHFLSIRKEYDRENRLVRVEDGTGARVCYTYDLMNNCTGEESLEDDRTGRKVLYAYDRAGRLVRKEAQLVKLDGGAATVQGSSITSYAYDRDNCLIFVKLPEGGTVRYVCI